MDQWMDGGAAELSVLEQIPQTYSNQQHFNIFSIDSQCVAKEGEEKKNPDIVFIAS